jgi:hypothetical protein
MDKYQLILRIDSAVYRRWRLYVLEKYGITPAGRTSGIIKKNSEIFEREILQIMEGEK